uniref:Uncharacterized protein n=1 Tax=Papaya meleira virus TaxID=1497848 RepID=A0A0H3U640_9VIRU|nr:hypothetical protein [Papaya meleira virus]
MNISNIPVGRLTSHAGFNLLKLASKLGKQNPPSKFAGGRRPNPGESGTSHGGPSSSSRPSRRRGKFALRRPAGVQWVEKHRSHANAARRSSPAEQRQESYTDSGPEALSSQSQERVMELGESSQAVRVQVPSQDGDRPTAVQAQASSAVEIEPIKVRSLVGERMAEEATRIAFRSLGWESRLPWPDPAGGLERVLEQTRTMMAIPGLGEELAEGFLGEPTSDIREEVVNGYQREVGWERLHWRFGKIWSPSTKMASRLRGHFGLRAPSSANALLGEHWLLEQYGAGLDASLAVCVAVKLWLTPTIKDEAISLFRPFLVGP